MQARLNRVESTVFTAPRLWVLRGCSGVKVTISPLDATFTEISSQTLLRGFHQIGSIPVESMIYANGQAEGLSVSAPTDDLNPLDATFTKMGGGSFRVAAATAVAANH